MQADLFQKSHRRHVKELNIVPILDMMTTVIFFLLLSTSFIEFTKITVPPSSVSTITDPIAPPPVTPRIILMQKKEGFRIQLSWTGREAGSLFDRLTVNQIEESLAAKKKLNPTSEINASEVASLELMKKVANLVGEFNKKYPSEMNFQVGMGGRIEYQSLIGIMDGIQIGVGALEWSDEGKLQAPKISEDRQKKLDPANIILVSYAEVDAETQKSGEEL